jgi:hypothetical protein
VPSKLPITFLTPRLGPDHIVCPIVHDKRAEVLGTVLDGRNPDVRVVNDMPSRFPGKLRRFVQACVPLLRDGCRAGRTCLFYQLNDVAFVL